MAAEPGPKQHRGYAWAMNVERLVGQDSFELAPGHVLRLATLPERTRIHNVLRQMQGVTRIPEFLWTYSFPPAADGSIHQLPPQHWRYFVIAFMEEGHKLDQIKYASDIAPVGLEIGVYLGDEGRSSLFTGRLFHVLEELNFDRSRFFRDIDATVVNEICRLRDLIEAHDHEVLDLRRFFDQLRSLHALSHSSHLRFLGYFGILEALLTHKPDPHDTIDSITRQVKAKLLLLDNRWTPRLDYSEFGVAHSDKVWTKMYACRSAYAHGSAADFKNELRILRSPGKAFGLLIETVKALMRYALEEPQLMVDLRNC